jgi:hypothetical protein
MYRYCKIVLDKITVYPYYLTIKQAEPGGTGQKGCDMDALTLWQDINKNKLHIIVKRFSEEIVATHKGEPSRKERLEYEKKYGDIVVLAPECGAYSEALEKLNKK